MTIKVIGGGDGELLQLIEPAEPTQKFGYGFIACGIVAAMVIDDNFGQLIAMVFAVGGLATVLAASRYEVTFNPDQKILSLDKQSVISTQSLTLPLSSIAAIEFVEADIRKLDESRMFAYCIFIRRKSGKSLQVSAQVSWGREEKRFAAEELARVLNVPLV